MRFLTDNDSGVNWEEFVKTLSVNTAAYEKRMLIPREKNMDDRVTTYLYCR